MRNLDLDHENVLATTLPCERHCLPVRCQATAETGTYQKTKIQKGIGSEEIFPKRDPHRQNRKHPVNLIQNKRLAPKSAA
jgi:hypothetical protein